MTEDASTALPARQRYQDVRMLYSAVASFDLDSAATNYLTSRYLDYLVWVENGALANMRIYYALRIPALILAATVPALVALNLGTIGRTVAVVLSVVVAVTTAIEYFLNSGQRWRHYRRTAELMKSEAWLYLQLAGDYATYPTHDAALPSFVARAEAITRDEVREYVTAVVAEHRTDAHESP